MTVVTAFDADKRPWPPANDEEERLIAKAQESSAAFYTTTNTDPDFLQGDVVAFASSIPVIDEEGDVFAFDPIEHWLVLTNTCDLARNVEDGEFATIVPIIPMPALETAEEKLAITKYQVTDVFYLPDWRTSAEIVADFTRFVAVHRTALKDRATTVARMGFYSWALFNACVIRHLCRGDGRNT